jgi:DNA-binding NarL/FixJ family response regulator
MAGQTRLVLAEDHPIFLGGLRTLLSAERDLEIVGEADTGPAALRVVLEKRPDVAILHVSIPQLNGITVARRIGEDCPGTRILMLTLHEDRPYLRQALQAGVQGYVLKRSASVFLVQAIRAIMITGIYIDPAIADWMFDAQANRGKQLPPIGVLPELTAREVEVLKLIAAGLSNKEIARKLDIGVKSVETFKARAVEKLGLKSRSEVVRYAIREGWLGDF